MPITITGPNWPTTRTLQEALQGVPENGTFQLGGAKLNATKQLEQFRSVGLSTPEFTHNRAEAEAWVREGCTVLGRREDHSQGRDIVAASSRRDFGSRWRTRDWYSVYQRSDTEWRLHVFDGRVIARGKKVYTGPRGYGHLGGAEIRSRRLGWTLEHRSEPTDAIRDAAKAAVESLGYLYGAVDLLVTPDGRVVVLEVNRLPAIRDSYTLGRYVEAIRRYVSGHPVRKRPAAPEAQPEVPYEGVVVI